MNKLANQLIKLGYTNPELRPHLTPILDTIKVAMRVPRFNDRYLDMFFAEKDLYEKTYRVVNSFGDEHLIPTSVVLEHIALTRGAEREGIKNIIRQIDFKNGDLHHFFEHLAKAIAENYGEF